MTIKFWLWTVLAMSPVSAYAINPASDTAVSDIQKQIYAANRMDYQIGIAVQAVNDAEALKRSPESIDALKKQVVREKAKKNAALTKAIHMTIHAYGLAPANPAGTSVMRSTKGRKLTWLPVAREMEAHEIERLNGSRSEIAQPKEKVYGITYPDGTTFMDPSVFEDGPGFLASYLLHERIHFEQITTDGKANKLTYAALQEEAYKAQVDNANSFFDPKKPSRLMDDIARLRDDQTKIVEQEKKESETIKGRLRALLPRPNVEIFEARVHTNAELADISGLVATARSQAAVARRDREEREARAQAAADDAARRDHDRRLRDAMLDMARRSCASPGSVDQSELDGLAVPHDKDFVKAYPQGADDCVVRVFYSLERGTDANELRIRSAPLTAADARVSVPPIHVVPAVASKRFDASLPMLQHYAQAACRTQGQVPLDKELTNPRQPFQFSKDWDDRAADDLAVGLGRCESLLFRKLIELIRAGEGSRIDAKWVQDAAAIYRSIPEPAPGYVPPTGGGRAPRCEDYGNIRCP